MMPLLQLSTMKFFDKKLKIIMQIIQRLKKYILLLADLLEYTFIKIPFNIKIIF